MSTRASGWVPIAASSDWTDGFSTGRLASMSITGWADSSACTSRSTRSEAGSAQWASSIASTRGDSSASHATSHWHP